jgi:hypothetical protein
MPTATIVYRPNAMGAVNEIGTTHVSPEFDPTYSQRDLEHVPTLDRCALEHHL